MPRTSTPLEVDGPLASAWPSTSGIAASDAGHLRDARRHVGIVGELRIHRLDDEVTVQPEDLVDELLAEAVHHRHDDDQRHDADHDAEQRQEGDQEAGGVLAARPHVACGDHPFEARERPRAGRVSHASSRPPLPLRLQRDVSRLSAASSESVSRSPLARRFTSTSPRGRPLRADDRLPGQTDQIHRRKLRSGAFVAIIVEGGDSGFHEAFVKAVRRDIGRGVAGLQIDQADARKARRSPAR